MTKYIFSILVLAMVFTGCTTDSNNGSANNTSKGGGVSNVYQYPFRSAKIEYAISGSTQGTETLYIKGDKSAREIHTVAQGRAGEEKKNNLYINSGSLDAYMIDLDKKTGIKVEDPFYEAVIKIAPAKRVEFLRKIAVKGQLPESADAPDLKMLRQENIAGQQCQTYEMPGFGEVCLLSSVPLKSKVTISEAGVDVNSVATNIQLNIDIPDSKFTVPAGVTIQ